MYQPEKLKARRKELKLTQKDIDEYKNVLTLKLKEIENRKAKMREELAPMREAVQAIRRGR